jgi:choline dehydrogenase
MSAEPLVKGDPTDGWDYIIIGAGTAGCILANRLSADATSKVLALEAGGEDNKLRYKLVAMSTECMNNPESDWMFLSEPDPTRAGKVDLMSRGKVIGGSSSINGSIYVRGNRGDYDAWAQMGNRGWSYDDILPYFQRVEGNRDGVSDAYGKSGPVVVGGLRGVPRLSHVFVEAMAELGFGKDPSYNGDPAEGASIVHANQHLGVRYSAARAYLHPARNRANLKVVTHVFVRRVLFEGRRAVGIEFEVGGKTVVERALREVILSASAFNSPKIQMLSGIGDPRSIGRRQRSGSSRQCGGRAQPAGSSGHERQRPRQRPHGEPRRQSSGQVEAWSAFRLHPRRRSDLRAFGHRLDPHEP